MQHWAICWDWVDGGLIWFVLWMVIEQQMREDWFVSSLILEDLCTKFASLCPHKYYQVFPSLSIWYGSSQECVIVTACPRDHLISDLIPQYLEILCDLLSEHLTEVSHEALIVEG